jgi:hypothetical protein
MNIHSPDLSATFAHDVDDECFAFDCASLPRFVFLMVRLYSFGYTQWVQSAYCPLPEFVKKTVPHLDDAAFCATNRSLVVSTARAMFAHYPAYQHWLCGISPRHAQTTQTEFEKYRFLSAPIGQIKGLCKTSKARMHEQGILSLHQLLLTMTYPEIRMLALWTASEAERLLPRFIAFGMIPAAAHHDLIITADQVLDYTHDLIG